METKEVLQKLRRGHGWSQDELAEKVFVTRQAVSRWETGETVPNIESLRLLRRCWRLDQYAARVAAEAVLPVLRNAARG